MALKELLKQRVMEKLNFSQEVISMNTFMANPDKIERKWYVVDAEGCTLGRLASEVAKVLRGKNKPEYTPHVDTGDYVIVINADKVAVTGKKLDQKINRQMQENFSYYGKKIEKVNPQMQDTSKSNGETKP